MELKEFIKTSLLEIIEGVVETQTNLPAGARVNPHWERNATNKDDMVERGTGVRVQEVAFDVAVTAQEGTSTKAGIGVVAGIFALGSQGQSNAANQSISRLRFSVPVCFPVQRPPPKAENAQR